MPLELPFPEFGGGVRTDWTQDQQRKGGYDNRKESSAESLIRVHTVVGFESLGRERHVLTKFSALWQRLVAEFRGVFRPTKATAWISFQAVAPYSPRHSSARHGCEISLPRRAKISDAQTRCGHHAPSWSLEFGACLEFRTRASFLHRHDEILQDAVLSLRRNCCGLHGHKCSVRSKPSLIIKGAGTNTTSQTRMTRRTGRRLRKRRSPSTPAACSKK